MVIYTRLLCQNETSIWGKYFPDFNTVERRLYSLDTIEAAIRSIPGLALDTIKLFRFDRVSSLERLVEKARAGHYSTFSLYKKERLEECISEFRENIMRNFSDTEPDPLDRRKRLTDREGLLSRDQHLMPHLRGLHGFVQEMTQMKREKEIAPASGKLGVLLPGMGAVATTFIAGVELVRRGLGVPVGSMTQLGTIRLGKSAAQRVLKIRDFVPLASLSDLVFAGWDVFPDDCYTAALKARVLENAHLDLVKDFLQKIRPMPAVFDPAYVPRLRGGTNIKSAREQDGFGSMPHRGYRAIPKRRPRSTESS